MMKPKSLNREAVQLAATMLMLAGGSTSTLTVKEYLHNRGYRAGQSEVSSWLFRIATRERWIINDDGTYRVFYFPNFMRLPLAGSRPGNQAARIC